MTIDFITHHYSGAANHAAPLQWCCKNKIKTWKIRFWCLVLAIPNGETVFFHHFIGGTVLVSTFYWWNSDSSTILLVEQC
jgi:hypothetical protein